MKSKIESLKKYLRETSFILWYFAVSIVTLIIFTVFNGQQLPQTVLRTVFDVCQFLWGLIGFTLIFKDKIVYGPITIEGNILKFIGWSIILFNWLKVIGHIVFGW